MTYVFDFQPTTCGLLFYLWLDRNHRYDLGVGTGVQKLKLKPCSFVGKVWLCCARRWESAPSVKTFTEMDFHIQTALSCGNVFIKVLTPWNKISRDGTRIALLQFSVRDMKSGGNIISIQRISIIIVPFMLDIYNIIDINTVTAVCVNSYIIIGY